MRGFSLLQFLIIVIISIIIVIVYTVKHPMKCVQYKQVTLIGGCDKNGYCGVSYNDGSSGWVRYPVVGDDVCLKQVPDEK